MTELSVRMARSSPDTHSTLPEQAIVTYARPATNKRVSGSLPRPHRWDRKLSCSTPTGSSIRTIPAADEAPLAIVDLSWADVGDSDGEPELLAANVGDIGLVAVDTEGETSLAQPGVSERHFARRRAARRHGLVGHVRHG